MTPDIVDLQARVAYLSDELARAKMALASPGCGEACPVATKLRALLASCDERLDEFGCGVCCVPPRAPVEAVPEAVGEAMTTMRKSLAQERAAHLATRQELSMALAERAHASAEAEMHKGLRAETLKANENLRAEVERLTRERDEARAGWTECLAEALGHHEDMQADNERLTRLLADKECGHD